MFRICSATDIGTFHIVNARQRRVQFRVFINNMLEILGFFLKLGIEHANAFFYQRGVFVTAITTIINNIITVILANLNIIHVVTACAKFHFEYILLLVYIYRFMLFYSSIL